MRNGGALEYLKTKLNIPQIKAEVPNFFSLRLGILSKVSGVAAEGAWVVNSWLGGAV
jgi:hypothetical protein